MRKILAVAALAAPIALTTPAFAAPGDPIKVSDNLTIDPIIEGRLRYEHVDQPAIDGDAVTMRLRAGAEFRMGRLAILAEGEGTLAIVDDYNAFPFASASNQRRTQYSVVPDPMNVELNRLQMQYKGKAATLTLGRQRINLDDQRWVGSVGWRQNEQTFDAVRGEAKFGPVSFDGTYAIAQRSIFGIDASPRRSMDGKFFFVGLGTSLGPVNVKGFAYLLDYHESYYLANSSQSYGARATAAFPLGKSVKLGILASYARQADYGRNPVDYSADFAVAEASLAIKSLSLTAGWELLGSDADAANGAGRAVQTPMATLHKFNGWADVFLTTPNAGLQDIYAGAAYKFDGVKALPGLNAAVTWHHFDSDSHDIDYGSEWDASMGVKLGRVALLAKYANYHAKSFGVDTEKLWLQAEFAY
jgi:hypothetical protein